MSYEGLMGSVSVGRVAVLGFREIGKGSSYVKFLHENGEHRGKRAVLYVYNSDGSNNWFSIGHGRWRIAVAAISRAAPRA